MKARFGIRKKERANLWQIRFGKHIREQSVVAVLAPPHADLASPLAFEVRERLLVLASVEIAFHLVPLASN